jgi:hypothetical protein
MYIGKDFDPSDPTENEVYALDFVNDIPATLTVASSVWTCVAVTGTDANASSRLVGGSSVSGTTKSTQRIAGLLAGVKYRLTATATLSDTTTVVSLYSHVSCNAPK